MQKRDLNKSIKCFIAEESLEDEEVNEAFNERSSEAGRPTFYTSEAVHVAMAILKQIKIQADKSNCASPIAIEGTSTAFKRQADIQRRAISHANVNELSDERVKSEPFLCLLRSLR